MAEAFVELVSRELRADMATESDEVRIAKMEMAIAALERHVIEDRAQHTEILSRMSHLEIELAKLINTLKILTYTLIGLGLGGGSLAGLKGLF